MLRIGWLIVAIGTLSACVGPGSVDCGDGHFCPALTQCGPNGACPVLPAHCDRFADGTPCAAAGRALCLGGRCTPSMCGDGFVDLAGGERCDQGPQNSDSRDAPCRPDCSPRRCGDGVVDDGEECDDGARNSDLVPGACRSSCRRPFCGDGILDPGESPFCFGLSHTPLGGTPVALALTDLDGDGVLDAVLAGTPAGGGVTVLLGRGDATFGPPRLFASGAGANAIGVGDLNGDGFPDVAVTDGADAAVSVLLNVGAGSLGPEQRIPAGHRPHGVAIADLDGNGLDDLVVTDEMDGTVTIWLGSMAGLSSPAVFPAGGSPSAVAVADLDGDGLRDVVVTNRGDGTVSLLRNVGGGALGSPEPHVAGTTPTALVLRDVTGDGRPDVVVALAGDGAVAVLDNGGGGLLGAPRVFAAGMSDSALTVGDVDSDGIDDIATADLIAGTVTVLHANSSHSFVTTPPLVTGGGPASIALADLDRDGITDGVVADVNNGVIVLHGGDGPVGHPRQFPVRSGASRFAIGDLDGDGRQDVLVADGPPGGLTLFRQWTGTSFAPPVAVPFAGQPGVLVLSDVDQDGHLDALAAVGQSASILFGDGSGGFPVRVTVSAGELISGIDLGDLDGDGQVDLVASVNSGDTIVFTGLGLRQFTMPRSLGLLPRGEGPLRLVDVDGDRALDVVRADFPSGTLQIFFGSGTAAPPIPGFSTTTVATAFVVEDVDRDGHLDLVACDNHTDTFTALLGMGRSFASRFSSAALLVPVGLDTGALNADAAVDAVVANQLGNSAALFLGTGDGRFVLAQTLPTGNGPAAVGIRDVTGDGISDVVVLAGSEGVLEVFPGRHLTPATAH